jgi:hypothetical protein
MSKYSIEQIKNQDVIEVWKSSPQSSIFTHPEVLCELATEVHWWGVYKGKELQCVWPIALNEKSNPIIAPFSYWQGPLWTKIGFNHPAHRTLSVKTSVYELFISFFLSKYNSIKASLHPSLFDVRAFDWWNYDNVDKPRFSIKPRYTATIDLQENKNAIEKYFRLVRRQELKKFNKIEELFFFNNECHHNELISLYCDTLDIDKWNVKNNLISILKIIDNGFGWIQSIRRKTDSSLCSLILILNDKNQANLVISLATSEFKSEGIVAAGILRAIKTTQIKKIRYFDFNGANSPNRGDDKHSYGGKPILYFDIDYKKVH